MFSFLKKIFFLLILIIILVVGYFVYFGYDMYKKSLDEISIEDKIEQVQKKKNYTELSNISKTYIDAILSIEDHRFYDHPGVDIFSIIRAIYINIRNQEIDQGGSTISQQLAKNLYFSQEKKLIRKIAELFVVYDLEKNYSKDLILELYLNSMYYGNGHYEIASATQDYFNKEPKDLTDYEATLLAGITNAPSVYSKEKNSDLAKQRQKQVLNAMIKNKKITEEQANLILESNN